MNVEKEKRGLIFVRVPFARKHGVSRQYITKIKRKVEKWSEPN